MPNRSVFLRHEWFDAAWQWASTDSQLYIIAIHESDSLIGIAPLIMRIAADDSKLRTLSFLTVPDTQSCDILAEPKRRGEVIRLVLRELGRRGDWDVLNLSYLTPSTAEEVSILAKAAGRPSMVIDQGANPGIKLQGTWNEYYGRRSRRLKKGNNLIVNKLKKGGHEFQLEHFTSGTSAARGRNRVDCSKISFPFPRIRGNVIPV